ncbi:MAG: SMP-30/gluconolactonase/LRE family protein [Devosia sp.]|nr:SMP-30/gluconolactonase/LRE family protein [Devosia sp.]
MDSPRRIGDTTDILGEGSVWCARGQALWWVDIQAPAVRRWEAATGEVRSWTMPEPVGSLALRTGDGLLVALKRGLAFLDTDTGAITPAAPPHGEDADMRFNDGRCDRQGRFWAGTMGEADPAPRGHLYRLDPVAGVAAVLHGLAIPNGLCWSPEGRTMYFTDSPTRTILAFAYDPTTGTPGERRVFARVEGPGIADGAIVDAEGHLWSAEYGAGRITRYAPDGRVDRRLALPVSKPTCCAFGGPDLSVLFVTSCSIGVSAAEPLAGAVLAFEPGVRGLAEARYGG